MCSLDTNIERYSFDDFCFSFDPASYFTHKRILRACHKTLSIFLSKSEEYITNFNVGRFVMGVGWPPNSRHRVTIRPSFRNKTKQALPTGQEKTRAQKHRSMTWAQRLKRVFGIEIETCEQCGGAVKVIASIDKSSGKTICTANAAPQGLDTGVCLINSH